MYKLISCIALCCFSVWVSAENYQNNPSPGPVITVMNQVQCTEEFPLCDNIYLPEKITLSFSYDVTYNYQGWDYRYGSSEYDIEDIATLDWSNSLGYDWVFQQLWVTTYNTYGIVKASKSCDYHGEGGLASVINPLLNKETVSHISVRVTLAQAELYPGGAEELVIECNLVDANVTYF